MNLGTTQLICDNNKNNYNNSLTAQFSLGSPVLQGCW